jgi:hypothetical protein
MDCKLMLQSTFDWAKKGVVTGGEFPSFATVFATVTIHKSFDRANKRSDSVLYANGPLTVTVKDGKEMLTGNIQAWTNKVSFIFLPPEPGQDINLPVEDLFPLNKRTGLLLRVEQGGKISVGELIDGKLIGGLPPISFQASCDKELLTGMVSDFAICTVSFSFGSMTL